MDKYILDNSVRTMTRQEVRAFDQWAIDQMGIPGVVLMENAGRACAEFLINQLGDEVDPGVCIFCGPGNNGGDGYVIARHLMNAHIDVRVVMCAPKHRIKGDAGINLKILENMGAIIQSLNVYEDEVESCVKTYTSDVNFIVDAVFGSGLHGVLDEHWSLLIDAINNRSIAVLAVDCPSGLDCNTGMPLGNSIRAHSTVSFVAVKQGFVKPDACKYTGTVYTACIGITSQP